MSPSRSTLLFCGILPLLIPTINYHQDLNLMVLIPPPSRSRWPVLMVMGGPEEHDCGYSSCVSNPNVIYLGNQS